MSWCLHFIYSHSLMVNVILRVLKWEWGGRGGLRLPWLLLVPPRKQDLGLLFQGLRLLSLYKATAEGRALVIQLLVLYCALLAVFLHWRQLLSVTLDRPLGFPRIVVDLLFFSSSSLSWQVSDLVSYYLHDAPPHCSAGSLHQFEVNFRAARHANISNICKMLLMEALVCTILAKINVFAVVLLVKQWECWTFLEVGSLEACAHAHA